MPEREPRVRVGSLATKAKKAGGFKNPRLEVGSPSVSIQRTADSLGLHVLREVQSLENIQEIPH